MRAVFALLLMLALLAGIACLSPKPPPSTSDLTITVPWPDQEQAHYVLLDRKSKEQMGEGTLSVTKQDGQYEMRQSFVGSEKHPGTDISTVDVDAETLKPISFHRRQALPNQTKEVKGDYDYVKGVVSIIEVTGGKDRPVPMRLPDNYYDNDTALFLWRTIPFSEGYTISYRTVITGGASQAVVQLKVLGKEQVTVPAGTFDAWKLDIRSAGQKQFAWFADTPDHTLVQYENRIYIFQLTGSP